MQRIDYPAMYRRVRANKSLVLFLRVAHTVSVILVVLAFLSYVAHCAFSVSYIYAINILAVSAVPFVTVSALRRLLGCPRPYEVMDFAELGMESPRRGRQDSFPSRHTFSAFLIGSLAVFDLPAVGAAVLALAVWLALTRVLLGYHFIRDVVVGAVIGTVTGVTGAICLMIF